MRLWLNRSAEVSLREQLSTQVVLGILTREILPAATAQHARAGAPLRHSSPTPPAPAIANWNATAGLSSATAAASSSPTRPPLRLSQVPRWRRSTHRRARGQSRKIGASDSLFRARLRRWLSLAPLARWLVIEPDPELAKCHRRNGIEPRPPRGLLHARRVQRRNPNCPLDSCLSAQQGRRGAQTPPAGTVLTVFQSTPWPQRSRPICSATFPSTPPILSASRRIGRNSSASAAP